MAYDLQNKPSMMEVLGTKTLKQLGQNLQLSQQQIMKANSTALAIANNPIFKNCLATSIAKACYEIARFNFVRDDSVYIIPYGNAVQTQIGYKGFRELAMRSGKYQTIDASVVYSCDRVFRDRETGEIKVEFNENIDAIENANVVGYYAFARLTNGEIANSVYMSKSKIEEHGKYYSKAYNSIWGKSMTFDKMALKTVIKKLCNLLDQSVELIEAKKQDQIVYDNDKKGYYDNPNYRPTQEITAEPIVEEQPILNENIDIVENVE